MNKRFVRQARLPKGAYPEKTLEQVLAPYMNNSTNMKWRNLKENKCPQCDKDLVGNSKKVYAQGQPAIEHRCGFTIREVRMMQIVSGQVSRDLEDRLNEEYEGQVYGK